ncbi:hypothetical protein E4U53_003351, partial [Claviceps sorghi]
MRKAPHTAPSQPGPPKTQPSKTPDQKHPRVSRKRTTEARQIMLRRPPTTLHVTPEDIAAYEDRRAAEARAEAEAQARLRMEGVQQGPVRREDRI